MLAPVGGSERWSFKSLKFLMEAWQWLDEQGRELDLRYELDRDRPLAVAR